MKTRTNALRALAAAAALALTLVPATASGAAQEGAAIGARITSQGALDHGEIYTFSGRIVTAERTLEAGARKVRVEFRRAGGDGWHRLKSVPARQSGAFKAKVRARVNGAVRAVSEAGLASPARSIRVNAALRLEKPQPNVYLGGKVRIHGTVKPGGHRRIKVVAGGRTIRTGTDRHGNYRATWRPTRAGDYRVRVFAAKNKLARGDESRRKPVSVFRPSHASYYGPGLYGNGVACGGTLTPSTMGVAHKYLPCGTKVTIRYHGREVTVPVIDRGPYIAGREWDLTEATRNRLGFGGVGTVWVNR